MLTKSTLQDIEKLQHVCEAADHIQLKLNWDMLRNREKDERNDFLHYENGELVGFLGLYGFGTKVELCGMVHPEFRRKGIFTKLFHEVMNEIDTRQTKEVLLNAPADSQSAKGFLHTVPCAYSFSEYQMKWQETELDGMEGVVIRPATQEDDEAQIQLDVLCFGFDVEDASDFQRRIKHEPYDKRYMIEKDGKTVGKIRVTTLNEEAWIYGFAVFPEYQGQGIGRKALKKTIMKAREEEGYPVFLEVEAKNAHALGLYESCGFKAFHTQDYYQYKK
jgi:ribosomal protein S18 acetylase RimI-like enzyme